MLCNFRQEFKEVMIDLLGIIAVGLTDKLDGIRQQDMPLCFLSFEPSLFSSAPYSTAIRTIINLPTMTPSTSYLIKIL